MSGISKNIRKITKAWGGKTTGSGIGDAVMDLYNSLPFGVTTEMVEILYKENLNGRDVKEGDEVVFYIETQNEDIKAFKPVPNNKYKIVINGEEHVLTCFEDDEGVYKISYGSWDDGVFFETSYDEAYGYNTGFQWSLSYGKTITLAIYEEQEVVEKLDPKFVDGGTTLYYTDGVYLFYDEDLASSVSKEDLINDMNKGCAYVRYDHDSASDYNYCIIEWRANPTDDHGTVTIISSVAPSLETTTFCTAEYVSADPS